MRNYFFDKGQQLSTAYGQYYLVYNKLDSHHYALERIENCSNNYVYDFYSSFQHCHFLRYYTCWEQEEETVVKKVVEKDNKDKDKDKQDGGEVKGAKKKTMNLASFLNKKKTQTATNQSLTPNKNETKSKKQLQPKKQQLIKVKVVYVQLQGFQKLTLPPTVPQIKISMALIYLLAQSIHKNQQIWPNMIPVVANDNTIKFMKKGSQKSAQLIFLFQYCMVNKKIELWSKQMQSIYQMYKINGDPQILAARIDHDLSIITNTEYEITMITDPNSPNHKKFQQKAKIVDADILLLLESGKKILLQEYNVIFSYIDQNTREVTLEHNIQDSIVLIGQSSNFVIRYLKTFRIK